MHPAIAGMLFVFVPLVVALTVVVIVAVTNRRKEQQRTVELESVARDLGFNFAADGEATFLRDLGQCELFSHGHSKKLSNLMRGRSNDLEVAVFDYRYTTGGGKHQHTSIQSVICFQFDGPGLPDFTLRPENFWHKVGAWLGQQDIDFESHPTFSKQYVLRGTDAEAVRKIFIDAVLEAYEQQPGLNTEASGDRLLYYRHGQRVAPPEVRGFMAEGFEILARFRPRQ